MHSLSSSTSSAQRAPFNRYFTPRPSTGSPSVSSCRSYPKFETSRDDSVYSFHNSRRASIDSSTSRASSYLATSPHHSRNPSLSPMSPLLSSSHSSSKKVYDSPADSHHNSPTASTSPRSPPTERNQTISRAAPEASHQDSQPSVKRYTLPVISIPPAQASDLTFDPTKKSTKRSSASKRRDKRNHASSSRRDSKDRSSSPPPVKYRFVSVHEAQPRRGQSSVAAARGGGRGLLRLEEHMEEERDEGVFEHGPTEFPPRPYPGGEYATSPFRQKKEAGKITGNSIDFLPVLEARFSRLETAIERYVDLRAEQALRNSILPGTSGYRSSSSKRSR